MRNRIAVISLFLAITLLWATAGVHAQPQHATESVGLAFPRMPRFSIPDTIPQGGDSGSILFTSDRDGDKENYRYDIDTRVTTRITNDPAFDAWPVASPDGRRICWESLRTGDLDIFCADREGSNPTNVTNETGIDGMPRFSPDGLTIAYHRLAPGEVNMQIWVMNVDGSNKRRLTNENSYMGQPGWFPDGRRLVFDGDRSSTRDLLTINLDGSGLTVINNRPGDQRSPSVSPDGQFIYYDSNEGGTTQLYRMRSDGSNQTALTTGSANNLLPQVSPDGTRLVFVSDRDSGDSEIYVSNADGSNPQRITNRVGVDETPSWANTPVVTGSIIGHVARLSQVTGQGGGGGLADVTITAALGANRYSTTTTGEGIFTFDNLPSGNYTVTPVKAGYQFTPASRTVTVPSFDALFVEFAAQGDSCGGSVAAVDVMLVIDRSGSMGGQPIADEKLAAKTFVDQMSLSRDQVGLASFADSASLDRQLTRDGYSVKVGIDSLVASGQTNMSAAINVAQTELRSSRHNTAARPVMIFMSDGQPNVDSGPAAIAAAQAAKSTGTRIFAVGLGSVDDSLMRQLASSATDYFYAPTSADLTRIYQNIAVVMNCAQAKVKVNPASKRVSLSGGAFTIDIVAQDITNMGAYQTELTFNALTLQAVSVTPGAFLGSTGRSVSPVGPVIDNNLGRITFGAFTFGTQPGVNGTGTLATITFSPRAKGTSTLHLQNLQVANPASTMLSAIPVDGQVEVAGCFGDFDGDNDVDIFDLQLAASHWNCRTGNTCYDAQFDAEPDGDIDVFDLQRFAAAWGSRCTTATQQSSLLDRPRPELTMADAVSLKLLPETPSVAPGHTFTVTVNIQNAVSVGTFQTDLVYDPTIVQVEAVTVGPFLSSSGRSVSSVGPAIDNSIGRVAFGAFTFGTAPGNSGGGDLAYVRLRAQGLGQTTLNFQQTGIGDTQGNPQYLGNLAGSSVTVSNQPQHRAYLPLTLRR